MHEKLSAACQYIQNVRKFKPSIGLVLGSGLGPFIKRIEDSTFIPYGDIPFFGETTVEGHPGRLILGFIGSVPRGHFAGTTSRLRGP